MEDRGLEPLTQKPQHSSRKRVTPTSSQPLAHSLDHETPNDPALTPSTDSLDYDLARLIDAWPTLLEPIRRAILALVESASGKGGTP